MHFASLGPKHHIHDKFRDSWCYYLKQKPPIKHGSPDQGSNGPGKTPKKGGGKGKRKNMDGHVGQFFESVSSVFRGSDTLPVCDRDIIAVSAPCPPPLPRESPWTPLARTFSYSAVYSALLLAACLGIQISAGVCGDSRIRRVLSDSPRRLVSSSAKGNCVPSWGFCVWAESTLLRFTLCLSKSVPVKLFPVALRGHVQQPDVL